MPFVGYKPFDEKSKCMHPEHHPPSMIVLPPGVHTYECPSCGLRQKIIIQPPPRLGDFKHVDERRNPEITFSTANTKTYKDTHACLVE